MLHRLEIENFYSIRTAQSIDLRVPASTPDSERLALLWRGSTERGAKVVALFGANASGKSNVLKALSFLAWFAKDSFRLGPDAWLPFSRFQDDEALELPTRIAALFSGPADLLHANAENAAECRYLYEVVLGGPSGSPPRVLTEVLKYWPSAEGGRQVRLFERRADGSVAAGKGFGLSGYRQALEKVLRPNASVISTLAHLEHPPSKFIWQAAATVVTNILLEKFEPSGDAITRHYADNPALLERLNRDLQRLGLGVRAMSLRRGENGPVALFEHEGLKGPLLPPFESHGTRLFVALFPLLVQALDSGGIAVIDELDLAIHPLVLPEIVRWFHDPERNPRNAQLWMTCQNPSLLEHLTKEEIVFCEKDSHGRTTVYALRDVQSVRRDDNFYRKYLSGVYGAVPQLG